MGNNPLNLRGIEFLEFGAPEPEYTHKLFLELGFSKVMCHKTKAIDYYEQNQIHFLLNREENSFASKFWEAHGPSACSMGLRVDDAQKALKIAQERGATPYLEGDYQDASGKPIPAIYGIGDSLIYFIDDFGSRSTYTKMGFKENPDKILTPQKGFILIDHLTNNVEKGQMAKWKKFYEEIFGFIQVRYFDIKGKKTGLTSHALKSPCGTFCIPVNEGTEDKSQINEYLREYKGAGIQHIAFMSHDLPKSIDALRGTSIQTLEIDPSYYDEVFDRVPNVSEEHKVLMDRQILVDGDQAGYLLQIFTKNLMGPIFIEMIQRKNHFSFGEGNFGALFRSIELDQEKRGVL